MRSEAGPDKRCSWVNLDDPLLVEYHDREWGVPVHSDHKHFEVLVLSGAQAGLNWSLVLKKLEGYRSLRQFRSRESSALFRETNPVPSGRCADYPQPHEDRRRGAQCPGVSQDPGGVRRLRLLLLAVRWWKAQTRPLENYATDSSDFPRIRDVEQGSQAARIQFRRANGSVCVHAGGRTGERPSCRLFSLSGTPE